MTDPVHYDDPARRDPRSVEELFNAALCEPEEQAWQAITALHWKGSRDVLERATQLCGSACSFEQTVGADVLGQLGLPDRTFPDESSAVLLRMLEAEQPPEVLQSIFIALGHLRHCRAIPAVSSYAQHPDADVRQAVVMALMEHKDNSAIEMLIELTRDSEACVRDWATFALGIQIEVDTPAIRQALVDRFTDSDDETRGEALRWLAHRQDPRVLTALARELKVSPTNGLALQAEDMLVGTELHEQLRLLMQR